MNDTTLIGLNSGDTISIDTRLIQTRSKFYQISEQDTIQDLIKMCDAIMKHHPDRSIDSIQEGCEQYLKGELRIMNPVLLETLQNENNHEEELEK